MLRDTLFLRLRLFTNERDSLLFFLSLYISFATLTVHLVPRGFLGFRDELYLIIRTHSQAVELACEWATCSAAVQ